MAMVAVVMKSPSFMSESSALGIGNHSDEFERRDRPTPVTADDLLGRIPPKDEHILDMTLEKSDGARHWHKRRAILTAKSLILSRIDDGFVREEIHLNLIEEIQAISRISTDDSLVSSNSQCTNKFSGTKSASIKFMGSTHRLDRGKESEVEREKNRSSFRTVKSFRNLIGNDETNHAGHTFDIIARIEELNSTVTYSLRVSTQKEMDCIIQAIEKAKHLLLISTQKSTALKSMQARLRAFYYGYSSRGVMAFLLLLNFAVDIVQAELQPQAGSAATRAFDALDAAFTAVFAADLLTNMLAHPLLPFLRSGWNLLDALIIALSIAGRAVDTGTGVNAFRTVRAVRVVRLLSGLSRLREIVDAIISSVIPNSPCISLVRKLIKSCLKVKSKPVK